LGSANHPALARLGRGLQIGRITGAKRAREIDTASRRDRCFVSDLPFSEYSGPTKGTRVSLKKNWPALAVILLLGILLAVGGAYIELYIFR